MKKDDDWTILWVSSALTLVMFSLFLITAAITGDAIWAIGCIATVLAWFIIWVILIIRI